MDDDPHKWERGETLASLKEFSIIAVLALKECLVDASKWAADKLKSD